MTGANFLSVYSFIFIISFLSWVVFEAWVFSRDRNTIKTDARDRGSRQWVIIMLVIGIVLGFNMPDIAPQFGIINNPFFFFFLGVALVYGGIIFRFWAIQTLGIFFRTNIIIQEGHQLITSGPYKYLRNPSYTGAVATLVGFGFGIGNWLSVAILLIAGLAAYAWRIKVEEDALRERFGQAFDDYRKKTWAFIPFIW